MTNQNQNGAVYVTDVLRRPRFWGAVVVVSVPLLLLICWLTGVGPMFLERAASQRHAASMAATATAVVEVQSQPADESPADEASPEPSATPTTDPYPPREEDMPTETPVPTATFLPTYTPTPTEEVVVELVDEVAEAACAEARSIEPARAFTVTAAGMPWFSWGDWRIPVPSPYPADGVYSEATFTFADAMSGVVIERAYFDDIAIGLYFCPRDGVARNLTPILQMVEVTPLTLQTQLSGNMQATLFSRNVNIKDGEALGQNQNAVYIGQISPGDIVYMVSKDDPDLREYVGGDLVFSYRIGPFSFDMEGTMMGVETWSYIPGAPPADAAITAATASGFDMAAYTNEANEAQENVSEAVEEARK